MQVRITLTTPGVNNKVSAVMELRETFGLGLKEALRIYADAIDNPSLPATEFESNYHEFKGGSKDYFDYSIWDFSMDVKKGETIPQVNKEEATTTLEQLKAVICNTVNKGQYDMAKALLDVLIEHS